jgi:hypothetical protein
MLDISPFLPQLQRLHLHYSILQWLIPSNGTPLPRLQYLHADSPFFAVKISKSSVSYPVESHSRFPRAKAAHVSSSHPLPVQLVIPRLRRDFPVLSRSACIISELKCRIANPTGGVDVWTQLGMFSTIETLHITLYDVTGFLRGLDTRCVNRDSKV